MRLPAEGSFGLADFTVLVSFFCIALFVGFGEAGVAGTAVVAAGAGAAGAAGAGAVCADAVVARKAVAIRVQANFLSMEILPLNSPPAS
jgi:hypothetical protein